MSAAVLVLVGALALIALVVVGLSMTIRLVVRIVVDELRNLGVLPRIAADRAKR